MSNRTIVSIGILVAALLVLGMLFRSSPATDSAVAAVATQQLPIERMAQVYATITTRQVDQYERAHSVLIGSRWSDFWANALQVFILTLIVAVCYFSYRAIPVIVESIKKRMSVVRTATGSVLLDYDDDGNMIGHSLERIPDKAHDHTIVYNKPTVSNETGRVIETVPTPDVYTDAALFLEQAMIKAGAESSILPSHDTMGIGGSRWDRMVNTVLSGIFEVKKTDKGMQTFCCDPDLPNLHTVYIAVKRQRVPLPRRGE